MELVFATNNKHKLEEAQSIIGDKFKLLSLNDINCHADIPETSDTLTGNALQKANFVMTNYGKSCFADDTGLEVEALNSEPGVYSARYAGEEHDSEKNMLKLLNNLKDKDNRKARFRTVIALLLGDKQYLFEGIVNGQIIREKRGLTGFGYDPIFVPDGYDKTFAELGEDIKNEISHRSRALHKLMAFLQTLTLLFLCILPVRSQGVGTWETFLSYYNTTAVAETSSKVYALANGSLFSYDKEDKSFKYYSRQDGLSDTQISQIGYNSSVGALLIVYSDGNIDILNNGGFYNLPYLTNSSVIKDKTINDVYFYGQNAYLSGNFGIMVINMQKKEISDTYRLDKVVRSLCVKDGYIYAATETGVIRGLMTDNLLDAAKWNDYSLGTTLFSSASINKINVYKDCLFFCLSKNGVYIQNDNAISAFVIDGSILNMTVQNDHLIAFTSSKAYIYTSLSDRDIVDLGTVNGISSLKDANTYWIAAGSESLKGIKKNSSGSYEVFMTDTLTSSNCPKRNLAAFMRVNNGQLLVTGGGRWADRYGNPGTLMTYTDGKWYNFDESAIATAAGIRFSDVTSVAVDPNDATHLFASTWGEGVFEFRNKEYVNHYSLGNSTLQSALGTDVDYVRVEGLCFDKDSNLWMTNSSVTNGLKVRKPDGTWLSVYYAGLSSQNLNDKILITSKNYKWVNVPRTKTGIMVINDKGTIEDQSDDASAFVESFSDVNGKAYSVSGYFCLAEDLNGQVWIGTNSGVIVCSSYSVTDNSTASFSCNKLIRSDSDGNLGYFLNDEKVTAIAVDGGNRKWIGTESSGVFLVNSDGSTTIKNFTTANSPLLSNNILSIAIDNLTGKVYIGTSEGINSYMSDATEGSDNYSKVSAYPNPVRPGDPDQVIITGLMSNSNVKITDLAGNLIYQARSNGGQMTWNCCNRAGKRVATGVYMVLAATEDSSESVVTKILIVR